MALELASATSLALSRAPLVLVPIGSIEQHGPHLPLDTDTVIAEAVAHGVAELLGFQEILIAPPFSYSSSGKRTPFAGASSMGTDALRLVLYEVASSMCTWARRLVFVNAHDGNVETMEQVVQQLRSEGHHVSWFPCATEGVAVHAECAKTSVMLHLLPWFVRQDRLGAENGAPLSEDPPARRAVGVPGISADNVVCGLGGATAQDGKQVLDEMARLIAHEINAASGESR